MTFHVPHRLARGLEAPRSELGVTICDVASGINDVPLPPDLTRIDVLGIEYDAAGLSISFDSAMLVDEAIRVVGSVEAAYAAGSRSDSCWR